ncbi:MAG TPA: phospho-sugar mutase, partial [Polyangiaceae bacterium]|nr:phospho-sugar mutase [Polyangiaceae bacterium]
RHQPRRAAGQAGMTEADEDLLLAARAWIDGDPDPATRAELSALLEPEHRASLASRMQPLTFGTAGLRGAVGAGSGRMNTAVVTRTAHGIARYLGEQAGVTDRPVVIGFDARPTSRGFAEISAGVLLTAGFRVVAFSEPTATPLCAFLGLELSASITIVVTASHNPRGDNGYKVYGANAVQIVSPVDAEIARHIALAPPARLVPCQAVDFDAPAPARLTLIRASELKGYFAAVSAAIPARAERRELSIVYSALHGVGAAPMRRTLADAGFTRIALVAAQAEPDGTFPTTPFPNPEEPGTLDLALREGDLCGSALVLVNDPDADRLAAAARLDGALRVLDGNQVGALLADYALSLHGSAATPLVLSSVVSSPLVGLLAVAGGAHHERTLTGFKWLWSAALELEQRGVGRFCFAYEEALGYSVFRAVRDKDGIAAGRALAELAALLQSRGETLFDRLYQLYAAHGLWASAARSVALRGGEANARLARCLDALPAYSNLQLAGERVLRIVDYRTGASQRPSWLGATPLFELELERGGRIFVRPSGTEPKLKLYGHVRHDVTLRSEFVRDLAEAQRLVSAQLEALETALQL